MKARHHDGQQRWQKDGEPDAEREEIHHGRAWLMAIRPQAGTTGCHPAGWGTLQLVLQGEQGGGQDELHQRQSARGGEIEVKAQRLIDSHLQRGGFRPAPQRQYGSEAGEAEHKDEAGQPRQYAADQRPLQQPEDMG